jgi:hypothetical protein
VGPSTLPTISAISSGVFSCGVDARALDFILWGACVSQQPSQYASLQTPQNQKTWGDVFSHSGHFVESGPSVAVGETGASVIVLSSWCWVGTGGGCCDVVGEEAATFSTKHRGISGLCSSVKRCLGLKGAAGRLWERGGGDEHLSSTTTCSGTALACPSRSPCARIWLVGEMREEFLERL